MELALRRTSQDVLVPDDADYLAEVADILENETFLSMKEFVQHGATSCLDHCIAVSYRSYISCKKAGLNARAAARAGLLHDMFLYDWHLHKVEGLPHGFSHPRAALENAQKEFELSEMEKDIILKHMWPLTPIPPRHKEGYVVLYHDKVCSVKEAFGRPTLDCLQPQE